MAVKPPEILNRLPSVAELLEKPPIRALADRWNRSVVAGSVRTFLDELTSDLRRRAADVQLPTMRELAEHAARYIVSRQQQQLGTAINATGRIWGAPWISRPLPDAALERAVAIGRDFVAEPTPSGNHNAVTESALCEFTGAEAAIAVHSYSAANWLAIATLAADREVLVARAEVGDVGPATPLPKLVSSAGAQLREVGTINRALSADYDSVVSSKSAVLLAVSPDEYRVVGQTAAAELEQLAALARERALVMIAALGTAPLVDQPAVIKWPQNSARAALAAGVDVVTLRGDGLIGGPPCGILLGSREVIGRIAQHPLYSSLQLDEFRSAALAAALECHKDTPSSAEDLPTWQLLGTSIENLRNRAERIAPQLAKSVEVASAIATETRSPISAALAADGGLMSYGVALTPRNGSIADLDQRLQALPLPIIGRVENDRLVLDLRTVLPRQDRSLVEGIAGASDQGGPSPPTS